MFQPPRYIFILFKKKRYNFFTLLTKPNQLTYWKILIYFIWRLFYSKRFFFLIMEETTRILFLFKKKEDLPLLLRIGWERIILDEAHEIKNHKSIKAQSVCRLRAAHRWALSGTPIQNNLKDMYSLLRFVSWVPDLWTNPHFHICKIQSHGVSRLGSSVLYSD